MARVPAQLLGRAHRVLRQRLGLRQQDVAERSGLSRAKVSRLECGRLAELCINDIERSFAVLDARVELRAVWHGAALDRLIDEGHARLGGHVAELLRRLDWQVEVEVTFSRYGERGSIDILAWHAQSSTLLVIEIKTELGSIDGLLRPLDMKARLAAQIARERFGWQASRVGRVVVLSESRTARRNVERHGRILSAALPARSREVRAWLANPSGSIAGLWFLSHDAPMSVTQNPSSIRRVRRPRATAIVHG